MADLFGNISIKPRYSWREDVKGTEEVDKLKRGQASKLALVYKYELRLPWLSHPEPVKHFFCKTIPCTARAAKYARTEYDILRRLRHEHVVRYEDFEYQAGRSPTLYLYMEYCRHGDLGHYVSDAELTTKQACQVIQQISSALVYIHYGLVAPTNGESVIDDGLVEPASNTIITPAKHSYTIHRDIKPQNSKGIEFAKASSC